MGPLLRLACALALAPCALLFGLQPASAQPSDPLIGLWSWRTVSKPTLRGPLILTRRGATWTAAIAGRKAVGRTAAAARSWSPATGRPCISPAVRLPAASP